MDYNKLLDNLYELKLDLYCKGNDKGIRYEDNKDIALIQKAMDVISLINRNEHPPKFNEIEENKNYIVTYDTDIWDLESVVQFNEITMDMFPNNTFMFLPGCKLTEEA